MVYVVEDNVLPLRLACRAPHPAGKSVNITLRLMEQLADRLLWARFPAAISAACCYRNATVDAHISADVIDDPLEAIHPSL